MLLSSIVMSNTKECIFEGMNMLFNSFIFILVLMPFTLLFYFLGNKLNITVGKSVLVIASIIFYGFGDWKALIALGISILFNYY